MCEYLGELTRAVGALVTTYSATFATSPQLKRHQGALKAVAAAHKTFMAKSVAAAIEKM